MINKKTFTKMAKQVLSSSPKIQKSKLIHPSREWKIGVLVSTIIFVLISIWSAQTYMQYRNAASEQNQLEEIDPIVYRKSLVRSVLEEFSLKSKKHENYINTQVVNVQEEIFESQASSTSSTTQEIIPKDQEITEQVQSSTTSLSNTQNI